MINKFQSENQIDLLNPKIVKLFDYITNYNTHVYQAHEKIVTLSYNYYGTTSLWWLIILASGQIHPYEIQPGTTLLLPFLNQVSDGINALNAANNTVSKVVMI